jgi:molybdopterin adenylyltransferase
MATNHAHDRNDIAFLPLQIAIVTVSDTRDLSSDRSGALLQDKLQEAGHQCCQRIIVKDEADLIQQQVRELLQRPDVHSIIVTGGTGVTPRDVTPEAVEPLYQKPLPGFGELFRALSFQEIGAACIQSRASAGLTDGKVIWVLPGSTGACRLAMDSIILPQLDSRTRPCSFPGLLMVD